MRRLFIAAIIFSTLFAVRSALQAAEAKAVAYVTQQPAQTYYYNRYSNRRTQRQGFFARWMELERQKNARMRQMFRGR